MHYVSLDSHPKVRIIIRTIVSPFTGLNISELSKRTAEDEETIYELDYCVKDINSPKIRCVPLMNKYIRTMTNVILLHIYFEKILLYFLTCCNVCMILTFDGGKNLH